MPKISVIVPIYNAEKYLDKCISSLIHQTYSNLQILLINDGSTDSSLDIAQRYAQADSRIVILSQSNLGQAVARNLGLQHATGEYISFIDADDYIDADFYEFMLKHIGNYDCLQIGYKRVALDGSVLLEKLPRHFYQFASPCMRIYNRRLFTQHSLSFPTNVTYEDVGFSIDLWSLSPTYKMLKYTGYNYLKRAGSTTAQRNQPAEKALILLLKNKMREAHACLQKLIIIYTIIRLKFHFIRHDR